MSKTTGFQTERTKPFPITELDFSKNEITGEGIGAVVQFARTQGSDATLVDLSKNKLDDDAATSEVTRLVKNYSAFAANSFISTLLLSGNNIGRAGAPRGPARHPPLLPPPLVEGLRGAARAPEPARARPSPPEPIAAPAAPAQAR